MTSDTFNSRAARRLDDLLLGLDPARAAELIAAIPVAHADQIKAATDHIVTATGAHTDLASEVPQWLRLQMLTQYAAWVDGNARTCLHDPRPARPQPVVANGDTPNTTVCIHCSHLILAGDHTVANRTCDHCGTVVTGELGTDPIWCSMLALGPFMYLFGVCTACFDELPATFHKDQR